MRYRKSWRGCFSLISQIHARAHVGTCAHTCTSAHAQTRTHGQNQIDAVFNCTANRVKIKHKLTNFTKLIRIARYNGKYGSNSQGSREIFYVFFKFHQIRRWINDRNKGKWYFKKEELKTNRRNKKSMNLTLISRRNWRLKRGDISENVNHKISKIKTEIKLNYDSKLKLNTKRR